jgi:hypothetical protein
MFKKILIISLILAGFAGASWYIYEKYINQFSTFQKDVIEVVLADNI